MPPCIPLGAFELIGPLTIRSGIGTSITPTTSTRQSQQHLIETCSVSDVCVFFLHPVDSDDLLICFCLFRGFFVILAVASVSTLIDVIKGRAPMAFGSQHVAMLLAAWWPAIVFGE